jgi:hypothetical protein
VACAGSVLLKFQSRVEEDPYGAMVGWSPRDGDPCSWNGVRCVHGRVVMLWVGCSLPPSDCAVVWNSISPSQHGWSWLPTTDVSFPCLTGLPFDCIFHGRRVQWHWLIVQWIFVLAAGARTFRSKNFLPLQLSWFDFTLNTWKETYQIFCRVYPNTSIVCFLIQTSYKTKLAVQWLTEWIRWWGFEWVNKESFIFRLEKFPCTLERL